MRPSGPTATDSGFFNPVANVLGGESAAKAGANEQTSMASDAKKRFMEYPLLAVYESGPESRVVLMRAAAEMEMGLFVLPLAA